VGGDATDELVKDIAADETGDAETAADDMEKDMGADAEAGDTEERVADLEDALDELKAEFEKMMSGKMGDEEGSEEGSEEEKEEESVAPVADPNAELSMEAKHDDKKKEKMDEYKIQKSADNADHADNKKSPVADAGTKMGHGAKNIAQGGADEKGRPTPTAEKMGEFENTGGKDKSTSYKKEVKADNKDGSDKSAKSPVAKK